MGEKVCLNFIHHNLNLLIASIMPFLPIYKHQLRKNHEGKQREEDLYECSQVVCMGANVGDHNHRSSLFLWIYLFVHHTITAMHFDVNIAMMPTVGSKCNRQRISI